MDNTDDTRNKPREEGVGYAPEQMTDYPDQRTITWIEDETGDIVGQCNYLRATPAREAADDMLEALRGIERVLLRLMDDPSRADEIPEVITARAALATAQAPEPRSLNPINGE